MANFVDLDPSTITRMEENTSGDREALARISDYQRERVPYVITCAQWERVGRYIVFYVNPSSVDISLSWREQDQVIKGGIVRHSWRSHKSYVQEVKLAFTFQTGNTMPRIIEGEVVKGPGLDNLYDMLELSDLSRIDPDTGEPNYVRIFFNTAMFPVFNIVGFFDPDEFTIPQTADEPFNIEFNRTFTARIFYPKITSYVQLSQALKSSGMLGRIATSNKDQIEGELGDFVIPDSGSIVA